MSLSRGLGVMPTDRCRSPYRMHAVVAVSPAQPYQLGDAFSAKPSFTAVRETPFQGGRRPQGEAGVSVLGYGLCRQRAAPAERRLGLSFSLERGGRCGRASCQKSTGRSMEKSCCALREKRCGKQGRIREASLLATEARYTGRLPGFRSRLSRQDHPV